MKQLKVCLTYSQYTIEAIQGMCRNVNVSYLLQCKSDVHRYAHHKPEWAYRTESIILYWTAYDFYGNRNWFKNMTINKTKHFDHCYCSIWLFKCELRNYRHLFEKHTAPHTQNPYYYMNFIIRLLYLLHSFINKLQYMWHKANCNY